MTPRIVSIELTGDEAVVLFEWLARTSANESRPVEHPAEQTVLWNLQAALESKLTEPFDPNYKDLVAGARTRLGS